MVKKEDIQALPVVSTIALDITDPTRVANYVDLVRFQNLTSRNKQPIKNSTTQFQRNHRESLILNSRA